MLPVPFPGDLPDPGIEPASPALQADSLPLRHLGSLKVFKGVHQKRLLKFTKVWTDLLAEAD